MNESAKKLTANLAMGVFGAASCAAALVVWNEDTPLENLSAAQSPLATRYEQACLAQQAPLTSGVTIDHSTLTACIQGEHARAVRNQKEDALIGGGGLAALGGLMLISGITGAAGGRTRNREPDPNFDMA